VKLLATESELEPSLASLRRRIHKQHEAAADILATLQEAVQSWRIAEQLTPAEQMPVEIDDTSVEH
jgi:hypothetical protein